MTTIASVNHDEDSHDYGFVDGTEISIDLNSGEATMVREDGTMIALNWEGMVDELEQEKVRADEEEKIPRMPQDILREQFNIDPRTDLPYVVIALGEEGAL